MTEEQLDISNLISCTQDLVYEFIQSDGLVQPASASKIIQELKMADGRILYLSINVSWENPFKNLLPYSGED